MLLIIRLCWCSHIFNTSNPVWWIFLIECLAGFCKISGPNQKGICVRNGSWCQLTAVYIPPSIKWSYIFWNHNWAFVEDLAQKWFIFIVIWFNLDRFNGIRRLVPFHFCMFNRRVPSLKHSLILGPWLKESVFPSAGRSENVQRRRTDIHFISRSCLWSLQCASRYPTKCAMHCGNLSFTEGTCTNVTLLYIYK